MRVFTTGGVAKIFGVSAGLVTRKWCEGGLLKFWRVAGSKDRRFSESDVVAFAEEHGCDYALARLGSSGLVLINGFPLEDAVALASALPSWCRTLVVSDAFDLGRRVSDGASFVVFGPQADQDTVKATLALCGDRPHKVVHQESEDGSGKGWGANSCHARVYHAGATVRGVAAAFKALSTGQASRGTTNVIDAPPRVFG